MSNAQRGWMSIALVLAMTSGLSLVVGPHSMARAQDDTATSDDAEPDEAEATESPDAEARSHFEAATEYFDNTEYEDALVEFRYAYSRASPSARPAMLFNIAATLERLGRFNESADALERYLTEAEEPETPARLRARIVSLRRRADANRPTEGGGADGLLLGAGVALAVAGAGAISFAVFGGLALAEDGALEEGCFATRSCLPGDVSTLDTLTLAADISWVSAAVAGATGVVLLIVGLSAGDEPDAVSVAPLVGPREAGVQLGLAF